MRNKTSGFTLLELIIVVIVIGILASIALPRYIQIAEKGRAAEAKSILSAIRSSQIRYYAQYGAYSADIDDLDVGISSGKYFDFSVANNAASLGTADRNAVEAGGITDYTVVITDNGNLTSAAGSMYL